MHEPELAQRAGSSVRGDTARYHGASYPNGGRTGMRAPQRSRSTGRFGHREGVGICVNRRPVRSRIMAVSSRHVT